MCSARLEIIKRPSFLSDGPARSGHPAEDPNAAGRPGYL